MATLTIKNIPDDLYLAIKSQAADHHRSINSEVIVCLEHALILKPTVEKTLATARRLREKTATYKISEKKLKAAKEKGRL